MGGSTVSDCLTNNPITNDTKIKVIFLQKRKFKDSENNCYINENWNPINLPFNATFCEDEKITNIIQDGNTKKLEDFFNISIDNLTKLVLNKPRTPFESDNLFFDVFNINNKLFEDKEKNIPNFDNCKKLNKDFELISSDDIEEKFSIKFEYFIYHYKLIFIFNKETNKLQLELFRKTKGEYIFEKTILSNTCNLRKVFCKMFKKDFPIFMKESLLNKVKIITELSPMIYSKDIEDFEFYKNRKQTKTEDIKNMFKLKIESIIDLVAERINNKHFYELSTLLNKKNRILSKYFNDSEVFLDIFFNLNFTNNLSLILEKNDIATTENVKQILDNTLNDKFIEDIIDFDCLTNMMNFLNLEFKTFNYTHRDDIELKVSWLEHCKKQSIELCKE